MRFIATSLLAIVSYALMGQNLVPNADFEDYNLCPDFLAQMSRALDWQSFRGSPDYFNACDTVQFVGVPRNVWGFQQSAHGDAYAGIMTLEDGFFDDIREYLAVQLSMPLVVGTPVYLSFKAAPAVNVLGNGPGNQLRPQLTSEGIGMRFSMTPFNENNSFPLPNSAALYLSTPLTDTLNWVTVSGTYTPDSAYQWLVIGNFFSDSLINQLVLEPSGTWPGAYVYIDEVCVSYDPSHCELSSGLGEFDSRQFNVWPNPFSSVLSISCSECAGRPIDLELLDATGRQCYSVILPSTNKIDLDVSQLPPGLFVLRGRCGDEPLVPVRVFHSP